MHEKKFMDKGGQQVVSPRLLLPFALWEMASGNGGHLTNEERRDKIFLSGMVPNWLK